MITLFKTSTVYPLSELKKAMAVQLNELPCKISVVGQSDVIIRYELPCEPLDILTWLHNQNTEQKIYWSRRDGGLEMGGIGEACCLTEKDAPDDRTLFEQMATRLSGENPHLRFYGGMMFDSTKNESRWQALGARRFWIPQFELLRDGNETLFAFNIAVGDIQMEKVAAIHAALEQISFECKTSYRTPPKVQSREEIPSREEWNRILDRIYDSRTGRPVIEKIVLARESIFCFDKYINPVALLKHLKDRTPECFHFCFQTGKTQAFLGASPERLFKRKGTNLQTEALAGTAPRGMTAEEDTRIGNALCTSPKIAQEHQYVVDAIAAALNSLACSPHADATPRLLKLKNWQHLLTTFSGHLKEETADAAILEALHPTPAVGGTPRDKALSAIRDLEPFSRGWYAGPVGCVGFDAAEFAVAIRSALIDNDKLSLYAGAGIVEGSTAEDEWKEIEHKISNFIDVFNKHA